MAVLAGLIAELSHIDLEDINARGPERMHPGVPEFVPESRERTQARTPLIEDPKLLGCRLHGRPTHTESFSA